MRVEVEAGEVVIRLTPEEAEKVFVDHGECFVGIAVEDSLGALMDYNEALRALHERSER